MSKKSISVRSEAFTAVEPDSEARDTPWNVVIVNNLTLADSPIDFIN
jgi:hypothetical protein